MRTQPLDNAACRELFTECDITTPLKELAPSVDNTPITFNTKPKPEEIAALLGEARTIDEATGKPKGLAIAIFEDARAIAAEIAAEPSEDSGEPEPPPAENLSLFAAEAPAPPPAPYSLLPTPSSLSLGLASNSTTAIQVSLAAPGIRP